MDNAWFDSENIFNKETEKGWETTTKKIKFPDKRIELGKNMLMKEGLKSLVVKHLI